MKRKTIVNVCVIAVLVLLFVVLSLVVNNNAVGQYVDGDGFIMSAEDVDAYVADGGDIEELSTVESLTSMFSKIRTATQSCSFSRARSKCSVPMSSCPCFFAS